MPLTSGKNAMIPVPLDIPVIKMHIKQIYALERKSKLYEY